MTDDDIENGVNAMRWAAEEIKRLRAEVARLKREMEVQRMWYESPDRGEAGKVVDDVKKFLASLGSDDADPPNQEPPEEVA